MGMQNPANARITTNADTELIAAPGLGRRINIWSYTVDVEVAGTASLLRLENGAGGNVLGTLDTADDNNKLDRAYHASDNSAPARGYPLNENAALNIETSGSGAAVVIVNVIYEILG